MRLFIAFNFEEVVDSLTGIQNKLKDCGTGGNYTSRENLHLTLAFIGEYDDPDEILDVMDTVPFRPIEMRFDRLQLFNDMALVRIADNPGLESYVRRLRRALAEAGIPFDKKKFMAHITLIRKVSFPGDKQKKGWPEYSLDNVRVDHVSLMRSDRGKSGMIYTEIGSVEGDLA